MTEILLVVLALAMALAFLRLVRGPSLADRVVALDVVATAAVAVLIVRAVDHDQPVLLDVAVALALITFVGTVAFASYVERRARR
ncbi:monovalent cation/H+ antiporter complex subunit F [Haliangium sp.]|uniref:monovalent cation/H+ antiporter complex subunit F n=1 Tax=Haliangium sp. TaxID=2663208 RepID=UPI003D0FF47D